MVDILYTVALLAFIGVFIRAMWRRFGAHNDENDLNTTGVQPADASFTTSFRTAGLLGLLALFLLPFTGTSEREIADREKKYDYGPFKSGVWQSKSVKNPINTCDVQEFPSVFFENKEYYCGDNTLKLCSEVTKRKYQIRDGRYYSYTQDFMNSGMVVTLTHEYEKKDENTLIRRSTFNNRAAAIEAALRVNPTNSRQWAVEYISAIQDTISEHRFCKPYYGPTPKKA